MCGLVGIVDLRDRRPVDAALLGRMQAAILHRGPDQEGTHLEPGVGLAHRRLSIIDLSSGRQPLTNEDETITVVYNGEIYNYLPLIGELTTKGHHFKTRCDTEVIVHAWEEWGTSCLDRFTGMFAFALWDRNRDTLFLARDQMGIKPLYYAQRSDGMLLFSSELKGILVDPSIPRTVDHEAIEDYFSYGYIADPKTALRSVRTLPPGHMMTVRRGDGGALRPTRYWDISFKPLSEASEEEYAEELIARVKSSVRSQLVTEVPLGAFLSGGVDSSSVVALMALTSDTPVKTCSIAFRDEDFNESGYAELVAARYHTEHYSEVVSGDDFDLIEKLGDLYDEPYADMSALPTYRLCQLARRSVTVALSGDGGDESFAGYKGYALHTRLAMARAWVPPALRQILIGPIGAVYPKLDRAPRMFQAKRTLEKLALDEVDSYAFGWMIATPADRRAIFSDDFRRNLQGYEGYELFRGHAKAAPARDPLSLAQYLDMKLYLPADVLTKVDRASMAHSLEVRVPLLDHTLVDWASGLPPRLKLRGGEGKYLFKRGLAPYLPSEILHRQKMGFSVPAARWFRGPLRERVRSTVNALGQSPFFRPSALSRLVSEHERGVRDHSPLLWALMQYERFERKVLGRA